MKERVTLFVIDMTLDLEDKTTSDKVEEMKSFVLGAYQEEGIPQEEIWIVAHQVLRHA